MLRSSYDIDHFVAQSRGADDVLDYENLLYSCRSCNSTKGAQAVPDPRQVFSADSVRVYEDGRMEAITSQAARAIELLQLDDDEYRQFRRRWLRLLKLAERFDPEMYLDLLRYPDELPDLRMLRPPGGNSRPEGAKQCFFALRERGELPRVY